MLREDALILAIEAIIAQKPVLNPVDPLGVSGPASDGLPEQEHCTGSVSRAAEGAPSLCAASQMPCAVTHPHVQSHCPAARARLRSRCLLHSRRPQAR